MFSKSRLLNSLLASVSVGTVVTSLPAMANPDGANVRSGDVSITGIGTNSVVIDNQSLRAIVDWDSFSIGVGETTTINQISNDAAILNRVIGGDISEIYGKLISNGQVTLINENGITIGKDGLVDTNGFIASTLNVTDADFLGGGDMLFSQGIETGGGIKVHGKIRSVSGGDVFLLSREIEIGASGVIDSSGYVGLGAGEEILLKPTDSGDGRISIRAGKGRIINRGMIEGVSAELKAAGGNAYALAINNTGVVRATGASKSGGRVMLGGGGKVRNTGKVVAKRKVVVRSSAKIQNKGVVRATDGKNGGKIIFEAPEIQVESGSILDVSAALGGGRMFVGGGYQGANADRFGEEVEISNNAQNVTVEAGALLTADATSIGDGGDIVVWSDNSTVFAGKVSAAAADGKGGFAEVSGKKTLNIAGLEADLRGPDGFGELLLDPENITITSGGVTGANTVSDADIQAALAFASVTITTDTNDITLDRDGAGGNDATLTKGNADADAGDITIDEGVSIAWSNESTLTLDAAQDIIAAEDVSIQHSGDGDGDNGGGVTLTAGQDIKIGALTQADGNGNGSSGVAIGSEHGTTNVTAVRDVILQGGDAANAFAHIGYITDGDVSDAGTAHGAINVTAGRHVQVIGGEDADAGDANDVRFAFAQIGHGGATQSDASSVIAGGSITVRAGTIEEGNVELDGGYEDVANRAIIGHGVVRGSVSAVSQGDISGNIIVTAGLDTSGNSVVAAAGSDILINTNYASENAGDFDSVWAQIGHGAILGYVGTGVAGAEITHGRIDGNVTVTATDDLEMGLSVGANTSDDLFDITSKIGHGGVSFVGLDTSQVKGSNEISIVYGQIARFDDSVTNSNGATTHGTDINVNAGSITMTAVTTSQNSGGATGFVYDNGINNQIGHSFTSIYDSGAVPALAAPSLGSVTVPATTLENDYNGDEDTADGSLNETQTINDSGTNNTLASKLGVNTVEAYLALSDEAKETIDGNLTLWEKDALNQYLADHAAANANLGDGDSEVSTPINQTKTAAIDLDGNNSAADTVNESVSVASFTVDTSDQAAVDALTDDQRAALAAYIEANPPASPAPGPNGALNGGQVDLLISEGDITGNISVYDTDRTDGAGITLESGVAVGLNAITRDYMKNRIGHATFSGVKAHDGFSSTNINEDHDAGTVTIEQANILGANIIVDTETQGTASTADDAFEGDNQDIIVKATVAAGLSKAEDNTVRSVIGHGGEIAVISGNGGTTGIGNGTSGHGGDIDIQRGTVWDGTEHYGSNGAEYSYGGSVDITVRSSDQIVFETETKAALSKAEANHAFAAAGHGTFMSLSSGLGGSTSDSGTGGRGGDVTITWDADEGRDYGHGDNGYDDTARGIMGGINIFAHHDGMGDVDGDGDVDADDVTAGSAGYALSITSKDQAALSKADHNTDISQIGHGDFFEIVTGAGGEGGDLGGTSTVAQIGQIDGGRGGDIDVKLQDMKLTSDITVDVAGSILAEAIVQHALSPEKHGLVESVIGHANRAYAVAGDGAESGSTNQYGTVVGRDPDTANNGADDGSADSNLRDTNGEIERGGAVGGDGGDVTIAFGDITDRYVVTDNSDNSVSYLYDGFYEITAARYSGDNNVGVSGNSNSDILVYATHNEAESGTQLARSIYLHAETKHALSEGPGSEVNAQIGHEVRVQAQGGKGAASGAAHGATQSQVNFDTLQADYSGGNGGDAEAKTGFISGNVTLEAERQVEIFTQSGHGKETVVTTQIGHNAHLVSITREGGDGGDVSTQLGDVGNPVQEYWETTTSAVSGSTALGSPADKTITVDLDSDPSTNGDLNETQVPVDLNNDGTSGGTINEFVDFDGDGALGTDSTGTSAYSGSQADGKYDKDGNVTADANAVAYEISGGQITVYQAETILGNYDGSVDGNGDATYQLGINEFSTADYDGDGNTTSTAVAQQKTIALNDILTALSLPTDGTATVDQLSSAMATDLASTNPVLDAFQVEAAKQFIDDTATTSPSTASDPIFKLVLQDLNQDDQFSLGDSNQIGTNADNADTDTVDDIDRYYNDDGVGIVSDGNDTTTNDKQVQTATYSLLFGDNTTSSNDTGTGGAIGATENAAGDGVDQDLATGQQKFYKAGINPTNTIGKGAGASTLTYTADSGVEDAAMVYDQDGNPQFILVEDSTKSNERYYVANTADVRDAITANQNNGDNRYTIIATTGSNAAFDSNTSSDGSEGHSQFSYDDRFTRDGNGDIRSDVDLSAEAVLERSWVFNRSYTGAQDSNSAKFTYVDLNMDNNVDLVDFDGDNQFDVVDIDQNGVYDRIDGRVANTTGTDNNGNANVIDYAVNTGHSFDANKLEGGWSVADLSHSDGGRGGNANTSVEFIQGDVGVYTGNVNFAANEAFSVKTGTDEIWTATSNAGDGTILDADEDVKASGATDSLIVKVDVQDNIVATGGKEDTAVARVGHGSYLYADTAGELDDNKVGRTTFWTGTDSHGAATGGDAGMHAHNGSGGDGGDANVAAGGNRLVEWSDGGGKRTEIDHLVGDISVNTRMSKSDSTIRWNGAVSIDDDNDNEGGWVSNGGYAFVVDPKGNGLSQAEGYVGDRSEKANNESSANRVLVSSKVDNASGENIGIAQIGHGAISIADASEADGGKGKSGNGSEIEAHQTEIANGGAGGDSLAVQNHLKGDVSVYAGRAPDPAAEITSIEVIAEEGPRIVPGSSGDIVEAQIGHGRISYAGSGAGGISDDAQWIANGGRGGDATSIQREILDSAIILNSSDLFGHGIDIHAKALQGSNHIVRAQVGMGDLNFAESNAGAAAAPSKSSVVEQWNQQANGGRGGDAVALQAGYQYDITVDAGAAPDTTDTDKASLRVLTDAQNIFLGAENHILSTIGHGGYSHADNSAAEGGRGSYRSALGGISTGNSETPFSSFASYRDGGRGGNSISEIGIGGTGRSVTGRAGGSDTAYDKYSKNDTNGADIIVRTHDKSYDSDIYSGLEYAFTYGNVLDNGGSNGTNDIGIRTSAIFGHASRGRVIDLTNPNGLNILTDYSDGNSDGIPDAPVDLAKYDKLRADANSNPSDIYGRFDGIKVESKAGPKKNHDRAVDTNTAQIGHSGFNRAESVAGISGKTAFGRIAAGNANGGHAIQSIFSAKIQEGDGGNGGDAVARTGTINGDVTVSNTNSGFRDDVNSTWATGEVVLDHDGAVDTDQDADTNVVVRATGGTVSADHRVFARIGHNVSSEALTNSNGGNAARPPQPVINFQAAVSARAGAAGDASSIQGGVNGDIVVTAENSVVLEAKKTTLSGDEAFMVSIGHRLENDVVAEGTGGISGMIHAAAEQAWFKDNGDDNSDDATSLNANHATDATTVEGGEEKYMLATYAALYETKRKMEGTWNDAGAMSYAAAYATLTPYEQSLVAPVLGNPTATGEATTGRVINHYSAGNEVAITASENYFERPEFGKAIIRPTGAVDSKTYDDDTYNGSEIQTRVASAVKGTTSDTSNDHRFGSTVNNEGYGSGKDVSGIAGDQGKMDILTVIFGARDNDDKTNGVDDTTATGDTASLDVNEATKYGNIPSPSADEIETLRYVLGASGDGGNVRSIQETIGGAVTVTANAYDENGNDGSDHEQANARGIYVQTIDAALSGTKLFASIGHTSELIKARASAAGKHHDTAVQSAASIGGDGGDADVTQQQITGDITLNSAYVVDVQAKNGGLGTVEHDVRIGHHLIVGSILEALGSGANAAVVGGKGGTDTGLGTDTRNGNGGDVTITQGGVNAGININPTGDILEGEGINNDETVIRIFANNANISSDIIDVQIGHDQHVDSADAGDSGLLNPLNSPEKNKGLVGVLEGKGGDVVVTQAQLAGDLVLASAAALDETRTGVDIVEINTFTNNGKSRSLIGHDITAGDQWMDGSEIDGAAGNKLVAGQGGDSWVEMFDDVDGGDADSGSVKVYQGTNNTNDTTDTASDDYYEAITGDIIIGGRKDENASDGVASENHVKIIAKTGLGGEAYTELGHQLKLSAATEDALNKLAPSGPYTPGDAGDIDYVRGRIVGDIIVDTNDVNVTGADNGGYADVVAKTGSGGTAKVLLSHNWESNLETGRGGAGTDFSAGTYDGTDGPTDSAKASSLTIQAALKEVADKSDEDLTAIDVRDTKRLIMNTVAALQMAQQYTDRMNVAEQENLADALSLANTALARINSVYTDSELDGTFGITAGMDLDDNSTTSEDTLIRQTKLAAAEASDAILGALVGTALATTTYDGITLDTNDYTDISFAAVNSFARTGSSRLAEGVYTLLFGDHADGGDIRIDENTDLAAIDAVQTSGQVSVRGNATDGYASLVAGGGSGSVADIRLGHSHTVTNSTGHGAGEIDGGPVNGGVAGDGGSIEMADLISGNVSVSADEAVIHAKGVDASLVHLGHEATTKNYAGMADIFNAGHGNGGNITTTQTVSGDVTVSTNHLSKEEGAESGELATAGTSSVMRFGHLTEQNSESDGDHKTTSVGLVKAYNRAGDIASTQTTTGDVTFNLDLDADGSDTDLIIDVASNASNAIWIDHTATQFAMSGVYGHAANGGGETEAATEANGQTVTVTQTVTGDFTVTALEDLHIKGAATNGTLNIGQVATNTGISGQVVKTIYGDNYGERVTATQTVGGDITLNASRTVLIEEKGQIGHSATQTAKSADDGGHHDSFEGYGDAATPSVADIIATQAISGNIGFTAGQIDIVNKTGGEMHIGHDVHHILDTDMGTTDATEDFRSPGHIQATSSVNGTMSLVTDLSGVGSDDASIIPSTPTGHITLGGLSSGGDVHFGHKADTTSGHAETGPHEPNGSINSSQIIGTSDGGADFVVSADEDLLFDTGTKKVLVGHQIAELHAGLSASTNYGHELTYIDDNGDTQVSSMVQRVISNIDVDVDNYLEMAGAGEAQIGHESARNYAQIGVSDQWLSGDIAVDVGTDANGTAAGDVANKDDDAKIGDGSTTVQIGHEITAATNDNEVQIASGDIWLRVGADLDVNSAQIGHVGYDFDDIAVDEINSYDLAVAQAAARAAAREDDKEDNELSSGAGIGSIRNRIQGNTTIGAGQNSPNEDSNLSPDVMKLVSANINSGYGGKGNKDVGGQLRFFIPAQENLHVASVKFNDSASNGDAAPDRTASSPENVFENEGGNSHEHQFELMSTSAQYTDDIIGDGNFAFYFESKSEGFPTVRLFTLTLKNGSKIVFRSTGNVPGLAGQNGNNQTGSVNIGSLAGGEYLGTSSFEIDCEQSNLSLSECTEVERDIESGELELDGASFGAIAGGVFSLKQSVDLFSKFGQQVPVTKVETQAEANFLSRLRRLPSLQKTKTSFAARESNLAKQLMGNKTPSLAQVHRPLNIQPQDDVIGTYVDGGGDIWMRMSKKYPNSLSQTSSYVAFIAKPY